MTNYNERLDKILSDHGAEQGEFHYSLKQAITSLIKELVTEAKPELPALFAGLGDISVTMYKKGTDEFEQNLLKALQEKQMSNGDIADSLFIDEDELDNDNTLKALEEV